MRRKSGTGLLVALLAVACARSPAADTVLILRQRALETLEVTVEAEQLRVVVTKRVQTLEQKTIVIPPEKSAKIRNLFWDALRHQPTKRLSPVRGLAFEQEWRGDARSQVVRIQGYPLTAEERRAYVFINSLLPQQYRFLIDAGPYGRTAQK